MAGRSKSLATVAFLWLLAAGVWWLDRQGQLDGVRVRLHDSLRPAVRLAAWVFDPSENNSPLPGMTGRFPWQDWAAAEHWRRESQLAQSQLRTNEQQRRALLVENARLRHQLKMLQADEAIGAGRRLRFATEPAAIISVHGFAEGVRQLVLDQGRAAGIRESELVVAADAGLVADRGSADGTVPGDLIVEGSTLVGRVMDVGYWVSLVRPVTDPSFSTRVLIRGADATSRSVPASGILEGTGDGLCRVTGIPSTDVVESGNLVFVADINDLQGPLLYVGTVAAARFDAGGGWDVTVQPALDTRQLSAVRILHPAWETTESGANP